MLLRIEGALVLAFLSITVPAAGSPSVLLEFTGPSGAGLGRSVADAGDVDGDGISDVLIGAPVSYDDIPTTPGAAYVHSGADGALIHSVGGDSVGDRFGWAVAGLGDLNGDGRADFAASAIGQGPWGSKHAYVQVLSGLDGSVLHLFVGSADDLFGWSLASAGDVDGDGTGDLVVGSPGFGNGAGRCVVYSGKDGGILIAPAGESAGNEWSLGDRLGWSVAGAGDLNGDGHAEILAGTNEGIIYGRYAAVYSGADGSEMFRLGGGLEDRTFGVAVDGAGDVNGDGGLEIVIGHPSTFDACGRGRAKVFSSQGDLVHDLRGEVLHSTFGQSVAGVGDFDGDGFDDVAAGSRPSSFHRPLTKVFSGLDGSQLGAWLAGVDQASTSPIALAGMADLDGDGRREVISGSDASGVGGKVNVVAWDEHADELTEDFLPGDRLRGRLDEGDVDLALFPAPSGSKFGVEVGALSDGLVPVVRVFEFNCCDPGETLLDTWIGTVGTVRTFKAKPDSVYRVELSAKDGATGDYELETSAKFKKKSASKTKVKSSKPGEEFVEMKVKSMGNTELHATIDLLEGFGGGASVHLRTPEGDLQDVSAHVVWTSASRIEIHSLPLADPGSFRLCVGGFVDSGKASFKVKSVAAAGGIFEID